MSQRGCSGPPREWRSESGFGLTETVLSLTLFAVALTGIAVTAARVGAGLNGTYARTEALAVAQTQLETLLALPYDEVVGGAAESEGVRLTWVVSERDQVKEIVLVYRHDTPKRTVTRTLTAARVER